MEDDKYTIDTRFKRYLKSVGTETNPMYQNVFVTLYQVRDTHTRKILKTYKTKGWAQRYINQLIQETK